ncbi:MAG: PmoA family protein [Chitinophagaceae bacterium]|nr:PmoA family protein [Chitinophagaceae bacterium]
MRIRPVTPAAALLLFCYLKADAQIIARLTLTAGNTIQVPVAVNLDECTSLPAEKLSLREISGKDKAETAFQVENGMHRYLWWMLKPGKTGNRVFELSYTNSPAGTAGNSLNIEADGRNVLLSAYGKKVLQYTYGTHYPPAGVDTVFKRSGFIHPLWSPSGNILTRINAPDHYHHMGLWNPWTHVQFMGKEIDCWNLGDRKGTVRFAHFISKYKGPVFTGFKALQEHVAFNMPAQGEETIALNEVWNVRVYNTGNKVWICDFTSSLSCATDSTVILKEYRYGGFGFRASEAWNNSNSKVLTSEGKTRKDADASAARWCMIDGEMENGRSGILFMSYPANYNHPEPMRVWPNDANKRGDVFFSFSPTRNKDWILEPQKDHVLRYRMLIYDGEITAAQAGEAWNNFANPPLITIQKM